VQLNNSHGNKDIALEHFSLCCRLECLCRCYGVILLSIAPQISILTEEPLPVYIQFFRVQMQQTSYGGKAVKAKMQNNVIPSFKRFRVLSDHTFLHQFFPD